METDIRRMLFDGVVWSLSLFTALLLFAQAAWADSDIVTANCAACHTTAERGDFRERNIRVPH